MIMRTYIIVLAVVLSGTFAARAGNPRTLAGIIFEKSCRCVTDVIWDTTFVVVPGAEYTGLALETAGGERQQVYLMEIKPDSGLAMKVVLPCDGRDLSGGWKRQTLTEMAESLSDGGEDVVAMVNGDFWQMSDPINPRGPVHSGGVVLSSSWDYSPKVPQQALSFISVQEDGRPHIGERAGYDGMKSVLAECTGAGVIMLKDGKIPDIAYHMRDPRTAIGYAPDGTLWLLTADGRGFSGASGLTYAEMGDMFMALGCEAAANLDGGGSAQMLVKEPGTASHIIVNSPADGKERPVINAWAVIKSK